MFHTMHVAGLDRDLELFPVSDTLSIAAFILLGDAELTEACARELLLKAPAFDCLLTAEAKSIPLIHEMARQIGAPRYYVARKHMKVYLGRKAIATTVNSITTKGEQKLYLSEFDAAQIKGKRVLIVDDVISTGESLRALEELAVKAGAEVCGRMAVLAEGDAAKRQDIIYLEPLPLFQADGTPIKD